MSCVLLLLNSIFSLLCLALGTEEHPLMSYDFLYKKGVDSYLENDWGSCVASLEDALRDWHWWKQSIVRCREKCHVDSEESKSLLINPTVKERFYEELIINTLCLMQCKKAYFGSRMDRIVPTDVDKDFESRKPYDYLQFCYYQMRQYKKAANAAVTVLAAQPEHELMKINLRSFVTDYGVNWEKVVDQEREEYTKEYVLGHNAYLDDDFESAVLHMEKSLQLYFQAEKDCRLLCEAPFDQGWFPDFISSMSNHYTFTLRCKNRCRRNLATFYGDTVEDFLPSYFNYLQFSYYKVGRLRDACVAVASYLLLQPDDPLQMQNRQFYLLQDDVLEDYFDPLPELVEMKRIWDNFDILLEFIETNFIFLNDAELLEEIADDRHKESNKTNQLEMENIYGNLSSHGSPPHVPSPSDMSKDEL